MRSRTITIAGAIALASGAIALAHYPMTITPKAMVEPGEEVEFLITNGHPFMNDRVPVKRPERVGVYPPERRYRDLTAALTSTTTAQGTAAWRLNHTPQFAGDWIYSFHTGEITEKPHRRVQDFVKLVLHVRHETGAQVGWRRKVGDPLEILPLTRPYAIPAGTTFRGKVVFNTRSGPRGRKITSRPMLEAVIEAESYTPDQRPGTDYLPNNRLAVLSDDKGVFNVTLPTEGWWMLSVATDGGPGEQGSTSFLVRRAVLWLYVGNTTWDRARLLERRRAGKPAEAFRKEARVTAMIYSGRPSPSFKIQDPKDLYALQEKLQNLMLAKPGTPPGPTRLGALSIDTEFLWNVSRVVAEDGFLTVYDSENQPSVYRDVHDLRTWLWDKARAAGIEPPERAPTSRPTEGD